MILKPIIIDNWYTKNELKKVYEELDFYTKKEKMVTQHGNVAVKKGVDLADCYRIPLDTYYSREGRILSNILSFMYKFREENFHKKIENECKIYAGFKTTTRDSSMIAYYQESQYYESHNDTSTYTVLIWIYKEPKKFKGGDLILTDLKQKIECKNNRMVLFPGLLFHEVTEINMNKGKNKLGDGRYSIVHFFQG